jgi:hypothetical protein
MSEAESVPSDARMRSGSDISSASVESGRDEAPSMLQALASSINIMAMASAHVHADADDDDATSVGSDDDRGIDAAETATTLETPGAPHPSKSAHALKVLRASVRTVAILRGAIKTADQAARAALKKLKPSQQMQARMTYTFGLTNTALTFFLAGRSARLTAIYFTLKIVALMMMRWYTWKKRGWHYYLVDLCYVVSLGVSGITLGPILLRLITHQTAAPPEWLFRGLWGLAAGPLAWSVSAFSNRAFFHSMDHLGTLTIHVSPALVMYAVHFEGPAHTYGAMGSALVRSYDAYQWGLPLHFTSLQAFASSAHALASSIGYTWSCAMMLYMMWISVYSIIIFFVAAPRIKKRGYQTLFRFVIDGPNPVGKYFRSISSDEWTLRLLFICLHGAFAALTSLIAAVLFHSKALALAWVMTVGMTAVWNSSSMYMQAVSLYLQAKKEEKQRARADRKAADAKAD